MQDEAAGGPVLQGGCLCGGIRFEISGPVEGITQCHCSLCRKSNGSAFIATMVVSGDQFKWLSGEELVRTFARPSGYGVAFCAVCGSPAPDPNRSRTRYSIPAGLLDDDPPLRVAQHIFVGSKAQWDTVGGDAPQFDEFE
jgi:hypothetical protein